MRFFLTLLISVLIISCESYLPGFDFELFKETKANKLANAVKYENRDKIKEIITGNPELLETQDPKFGHSLLMLAVANNLKVSTEILLELGADPNVKSLTRTGTIIDTTTAMLIVANNYLKTSVCDLDILKLLVKYGGDVNSAVYIKYRNANYFSLKTPIERSIKSKCFDLIEYLLDNGADINTFDYKEGHSPLSDALVFGDLDLFYYLLVSRNAIVPKYVYVRPAHANKEREELTITDFLNEYEYTGKNKVLKSKILDYLKERGLE